MKKIIFIFIILILMGAKYENFIHMRLSQYKNDILIAYTYGYIYGKCNEDYSKGKNNILELAERYLEKIGK